MGEKNKKDGQKVVQLFSITERKTSIRKHFSMSDEESHGAHKRMLKITSGVLIVFFLRKALKRPYNK